MQRIPDLHIFLQMKEIMFVWCRPQQIVISVIFAQYLSYYIPTWVYVCLVSICVYISCSTRTSIDTKPNMQALT